MVGLFLKVLKQACGCSPHTTARCCDLLSRQGVEQSPFLSSEVFVCAVALERDNSRETAVKSLKTPRKRSSSSNNKRATPPHHQKKRSRLVHQAQSNIVAVHYPPPTERRERKGIAASSTTNRACLLQQQLS
jgi:hypothetical protein